MTAWHLEWQGYWPEYQREWIIEEHRADVLTVVSESPTGLIMSNELDIGTAVPTVLEFQHSYLSSEEIAEREEYYTIHAGQMVWIWDAREAHNKGRLYQERDLRGRSTDRFRWAHMRKTLLSCTYPVFLDLGKEYLLLVRSWPQREWNAREEYYNAETGDYQPGGYWARGLGTCQAFSKRTFVRAFQVTRPEVNRSQP